MPSVIGLVSSISFLFKKILDLVIKNNGEDWRRVRRRQQWPAVLKCTHNKYQQKKKLSGQPEGRKSDTNPTEKKKTGMPVTKL